MADSIWASQAGLRLVDQARRLKQWNKTAGIWCDRALTSRATLNRFWACRPIRRETFIAICQAVEVNWQAVADPGAIAPLSIADAISITDLPGPGSPFPSVEGPSWQSWGDAPDTSVFYGRVEELSRLESWIGEERCRLVAVLGMGGIGKTALTAKLGRRMGGDFEGVVWRSLRNAPPLEEILADFGQFFGYASEGDQPTHLDGKILALMEHLQSRRCLIVLDNLESILQEGDRTGRYRPGYEGYGQLLRWVADTPHQSCVLLTSRERPKGLANFEGHVLPVRCFQLSGLPEPEGREIFRTKGTFSGTDEDWRLLIGRYGGNPLALKIVASAVRDFFGSDITQFLAFLRQGPFIFDDIRELLERQFDRLTPLEQEIMYWLAINGEPVSFQMLQANLAKPLPPLEALESLASLQRRSLIEKSGDRFTQQPVVMEYVLHRFIEHVTEEITRRDLQLFCQHALIKSQAQEALRETQKIHIVQPLLYYLLARLGPPERLQATLEALLADLRGKPASEIGYAAGNLLNLLRELGGDRQSYDESSLVSWQTWSG